MRIENIVVHCSDSTWGCAREIRKWHLARGWRDIGYHFVICNGKPRPDFYLSTMDGAIEAGRFLDGNEFINGPEVGAHTLGYNQCSVGICMIGKDSFTPAQFGALIDLCAYLIKKYGLKPEAVIGHRETASGKREGKTCPNFDVAAIRTILKEICNER